MKPTYYSGRRILDAGYKLGATYYLIFGERSNGKTYFAKDLALNGDDKAKITSYIKDGKQSAYIRRWAEDIRGHRGRTLFDDMVRDGLIAKWTRNLWTKVVYKERSYYLARYDENLDRDVLDSKPFMYSFSLSEMDHNKSTSYPDVDKIFFDEFLTHSAYFPDEFVLFMNTVSTIVRKRQGVKIFMLGNTVSKYCPYFAEMGLTNIKSMKQGSIEAVVCGDGPKIVVEYCAESGNSKAITDPYFAFNNPKLKMITSGSWEIDIYPHLPFKYERKDVVYEYYIEFDGERLHCEVISKDNKLITFIHRKTTDIRDNGRSLVYTTEADPRPNYRRRMTHPTTRRERKILDMYLKDKVFYQDNEVGEVVNHYIQWCEDARASGVV